jgi:hypothetical protein
VAATPAPLLKQAAVSASASSGVDGYFADIAAFRSEVARSRDSSKFAVGPSAGARIGFSDNVKFASTTARVKDEFDVKNGFHFTFSS